MTEDYCKLASGIILSTIWREDDRTRILWITMLAVKGRDHRVLASVPGLAAVANIPIEDCRAGLKKLMSPDLDSRTKTHDGRRIAETDGGWVVLNGEKYRNFLSKQERNEYQARLMAERRAEGKVKPSAYRSKPPREGYVYYAGYGDKIKIGFSKNPWSRVVEMRTANHAIELLAVEEGTDKLEKERHNQFHADHVDREWYRSSPVLLEHIAETRRSNSHLPLAPVSSPLAVLGQAEAEAEVQAEAVQRVPQTHNFALTPDSPSAGESEHQAFIKGWTESFESFFGFKYAFSGRDAKAAQGLLKLGITRLDLLEIAKSAWQRSQKDRFATHSKRAATIHGFLDSLNQIRTELKNGHHGSPPSKPNPRNNGITIGPTDYATAKPRLQREIEAKRAAAAAMAGQVAAAEDHPPPD